MKSEFDVQKLIDKGIIENELDHERALIAERKLRLLSNENPKYKIVRNELRELIASYETKNWAEDSKIDISKIHENDLAEIIAEEERIFIEKRKASIRKKLKSLNLTQQQLGVILGHNSKSYISELINGICPFSLKDLIIIHRILNIELSDLIPTFLTQRDQNKIKTSISKLNNRKLNLTQESLEDN